MLIINGTAPTLTSTVGKRDSFTFRVLLGWLQYMVKTSKYRS